MSPCLYQRGLTRPDLCGSGGARAFTLLEIIIAMALAATLVSLVSVAVFSRLREATFDETIRQTRSALAMIREDARRGGEALRLIARENDEGRIELVGLAFDAPVADPFSFESDAPLLGEIDTSRIAFDEHASGRSAFEDRAPGRVYLTLPSGYTLERMTPEQRDAALLAMESGRREEQDALDPDLLPPGFDGGFGEIAHEPLTIGLFLPDGSVIAGEPPILSTPAGAMLEIKINPWTGSVSLEPLRPSDVFSSQFDDELDVPVDRARDDESDSMADEREGGGR